MVQRVPFRGSGARLTKTVHRIAERRIVQHAGVRPFHVLLQDSGMVRAIRGGCYVVCCHAVHIVLLQWLGVVGFADDRNRVWAIALTEYGMIAGAALVISARHAACPSCYTSNTWFGNLSEGELFRLSNKILDGLQYFNLYKFAQCMGTYPVLTALAIHRFDRTD